MNKKILLSAVLLSSITTVAQNFESRASFWVKPSKANTSSKQLNKNTSLENNSDQSLTTSIGSGQSNIYLVFKSDDVEAKDLMNFTYTCAQHTLTTRNINHQNVENIDEKIRNGAIVKYSFNFNAVGDKNYISFIDDVNDNTHLYEAIYVNDTFSELDHQQVQSYLSIKYGISLINDANYFNDKGKQIWNNNLNPEYNKSITGLGRSDYFGLNKLQTINSIDKRLEITTDGFSNNEYLFFGTNNLATNFINIDDVELLQSSWLVQTTKQSKLASLKFKLNTTLKTEGTYQLLINPNDVAFKLSENVLKVDGRIEGEYLVFDNVLFDIDGNGYDTFTIAYNAHTTTQAVKPEIVYGSSAVEAYPNPANINQTVTVTHNFDKATNLNVHVFTVDGKLVHKQEVNNTNNFVYETKFTAPGVYLIVSTYNGQVTTNKIVVK